MRELVKLDIEYQWKLGQEAIVEDYFEQFPELATASQAIDDLVEEELIVRQRLGKLPTRSELRCRFPEDSARLVALLEALPKSTRSGRSAISTELDTMASLSGHAHDSSGGSRVNSLALQEGFRVEQYVLREPLGRGAFAVVWRASDEKLKRQVALKILRGDRLVDKAVQRWKPSVPAAFWIFPTSRRCRVAVSRASLLSALKMAVSSISVR